MVLFIFQFLNSVSVCAILHMEYIHSFYIHSVRNMYTVHTRHTAYIHSINCNTGVYVAVAVAR